VRDEWGTGRPLSLSGFRCDVNAASEGRKGRVRIFAEVGPSASPAARGIYNSARARIFSRHESAESYCVSATAIVRPDVTPATLRLNSTTRARPDPTKPARTSTDFVGDPDGPTEFLGDPGRKKVRAGPFGPVGFV